jgi:hypothetical protein
MGGRIAQNAIERKLDLVPVLARRLLSEERMYGLHGVELNVRTAVEAMFLVAELKAAVLEEAEQAEDTLLVDLPLRPWWIPAFAWRRIPTKRSQFTLTVDRKVRYPHSTVAAQLGRPVVVREFGRTNW